MESQKIFYLRPALIKANPGQPRRVFDPEGLRELADSIRQYGILQPLTVRKVMGQYELVAGERRLRAARMAGMSEVPCLLCEVNGQDSSLIALVENLQRRDLDYFEEAQGFARLISAYGLSQDEAARRLGKSQSAVANKLRLLKHSPEMMQIIQENSLTERHARALLRLENEVERRQVVEAVLKKKMNVAQTDEYIDALLERRKPPAEQPPSNVRTLYVIKDVRMFLNTIDRAVDMMKNAGVHYDRDESEEDIVLTIKIPKRHGNLNMSLPAVATGE